MRKHKTYNKICILDTETTGVYWNADAPIQIAALICNNQGEIIDSFEEKIKTTHKIADDASKVQTLLFSATLPDWVKGVCF